MGFADVLGRKHYDVFISYRRETGDGHARLLRDRLVAKKYRVFLDITELRNGPFDTALYGIIDRCKDFFVVLTPHSLDRCSEEGDWVRCEIARALAMKKNIIPILVQSFTFPHELPEDIVALKFQNGINPATEFYDEFINKLPRLMRSRPRRPLVVAFLAILVGIVSLPWFVGLNGASPTSTGGQDKPLVDRGQARTDIERYPGGKGNPARPAQTGPTAPGEGKLKQEPFSGKWLGQWQLSVNAGRRMKRCVFVIRSVKDGIVEAAGTVESWSTWEKFTGRIEGNNLTLQGAAFINPTDNAAAYSPDSISLTLSEGGKSMTGRWSDAAGRDGNVTLELKEANIDNRPIEEFAEKDSF